MGRSSASLHGICLRVDSRVTAMSERHAESILRIIEHYGLNSMGRPIRILEVGAYAHFGAHMAAAILGGSSVAHDISPASLRVGSPERYS
jgi:hypothetical protein